MQSGARSNTALFGSAAHGHQADLPTFENTPRAAPRFPGAQPHPRRAQGAAQPTRSRSAPPRVVAAAGKPHGLDAARRLARKADFERLLRQGTRRSLSGYVFYIERRAAGAPRLGILISRKHASAAVDRNRIKRRIREAFRLEQHRLGALDVLVRPPYGVRGTPDMMRLLRELLAGLGA
jgi:ribonuclease P protein component